MSVDKWLNKRYDPINYNCAHFACEVFKDETGFDLSTCLHGFYGGKGTKDTSIKKIVRLHRPVSPCITLLIPNGSKEPHIGVYLRGRVLHLSKDVGVLYQRLELVKIGFATVRFYKCF